MSTIFSMIEAVQPKLMSPAVITFESSVSRIEELLLRLLILTEVRQFFSNIIVWHCG